ncbi:MAG: hypothetical protein JOZ31_13550 [Verrucomicrobia bacterium]|nr:hypothetical protein [Verrucomicrobiota bacterium]MBV8483180.1 hypothetical protein [Verrucomicrobiota bacterium]
MSTSDTKKLPALMRFPVLKSLTVLAWLALFSLQETYAAPNPDRLGNSNFSGNWTLDLRASTSLDPLMNQIGAGLLDRQYASQTRLKATLEQTDDELKIATRGPGFALEETLYLDGHNNQNNLKLLGATSVNARTAWSKDHKELVETHQIKTKQGKDGELIIKRSLMDQGRTLVVSYVLRLNGDPNQTSARQIWRKEG